MASETILEAHCLCKVSKFSISVSNESLPLPTHLCHCSICRHTHGTLCVFHAPIQPPTVGLTSFTAYASSENVTRYFCSTCGAHMLDYAKSDEQWYIAASAVEGPEALWKFSDHYNLGGTKDGGLSCWLSEVDGRIMKKWVTSPTNPESETGDWEDAVTFASSGPPDEKLHAYCHCKGVEFYIARPSGDVSTDLPPTLTSSDKTKWYASNDVCTSCRLASGCAICQWAFPTVSHITLADGSPYRRVFGTLKEYHSSPGISRTFCGRCGAVCAYHADDRPKMVDIAVGLFDAKSGARAEDWLEWRTHKLSFEEDVVCKGLVDGLKLGLKDWARGKNGPGSESS